MPIRIRLFAALLSLSLAGAGMAEEKIISGAFDLKALSTYLGTGTDRTLTARIDNYANAGTLKVGATAGRPDTLVLQRHSSDSDGVINVDSTFIDAKGFAGTLILKNLAFRLKPKAALIAGSDRNRPNHNLILDSCYLYADTLDGEFLSWQGDTLSRLEIRNSWFVAAGSNTGKASIYLSGGTATLSNCLFNFAGTITGASISTRFDAYSNTANRIQFSLTGVPTGGGDPAYSFSQNMIAYNGPVNALGGDAYYIMKASGFSEPRSVIQGNRIYGVWRGFDAPAGTKGIGTKLVLASPDGKYDGRTASELWNWYTDSLDASSGMLSGNSRLSRFNVMPGTVRADTVIGGDSVKVLFRNATFPRNFRWGFSPAPPLADSAYRLRDPLPMKLSFGPFQVESIQLASASTNGKPILLAQSAPGQFLPQPSTSRVGEIPSRFLNASPQARAYILVDSGNTPRGFNVEPSTGSFKRYEHLRFGKVDSAGQTSPVSDPNDAMPDSLRSLKQIFGFQTSATVNSIAMFASLPGTQPWARTEENALFWYWRSAGVFIPAVAGSVWGDSLLSGTFSYKSSQGRVILYLVEKLSIHAGNGFRKDIPGATLLSNSATGYQLRVDTSVLDPSRYASATRGYAFTWTGRGSGDILYLILKPGAPNAQVYVKVPGRDTADPYTAARDSSGNFNIPIGPADSGKVFFAAIQYNVLANIPFGGIVDGVSVDSLLSSTSGRLAFRDLALADVRNLGDNRDTVFRDTRFLGGKVVAAVGLSIAREYNLAFKSPFKSPPANLEFWWLVNGKWTRLPARANLGTDTAYVKMLPGATHVVLVERFQAPETYVIGQLVPNNDTLIFFLPKPAGSTPLTGYCLEVKVIDPVGQVDSSGCQVKAPGDTVKLPINHDIAYAYRVKYFITTQTGTADITREYQYGAQFGWDSRKRLNGDSTLSKIAQGRWRILATPVEAKLIDLLRHGKRTGDTAGIRDTTFVLDLKTNLNGEDRFDTLKTAGLNLKPGKAFLVASSHPLALTLDNLPNANRSAKPETLSLHPGWNLIGNPYPISLRQACIRLQKPHAFRLVALNRDAQARYSWAAHAEALVPFTGYAYFAPAAETLYIDPGDPAPAPPAAAKRASGASGSLEIVLVGPSGRSGMTLVRGAGEYAIPALPGLGGGLELRVGGNGGYWIKPVGDLGRIDEPVEIRAGSDGVARFGLAPGEGRPAPDFALIDEATGTVYDAAEAGTLPVRRGSGAYRLIAGDAAFVAGKAQAFLAAAPAELGMSQNFPNPARGLTRILLSWPATRARDRRGHLEVIDLQGRRMAWKRLEGIRVGSQAIDLDASGWKPGVYVYRLTVADGSRVLRLQKRMVVAP